jgi:DNA-binding IclR family transcriptional regulator
MSDQASDSIESHVIETVAKAPFALNLQEIAKRTGHPESLLEGCLNKLAAAGKMKMTADRASRTYYVDSRQLR